jgi:hypothetical protein
MFSDASRFAIFSRKGTIVGCGSQGSVQETGGGCRVCRRDPKEPEWETPAPRLAGPGESTPRAQEQCLGEALN